MKKEKELIEKSRMSEFFLYGVFTLFKPKRAIRIIIEKKPILMGVAIFIIGTYFSSWISFFFPENVSAEIARDLKGFPDFGIFLNSIIYPLVNFLIITPMVVLLKFLLEKFNKVRISYKSIFTLFFFTGYISIFISIIRFISVWLYPSIYVLDFVGDIDLLWCSFFIILGMNYLTAVSYIKLVCYWVAIVSIMALVIFSVPSYIADVGIQIAVGTKKNIFEKAYTVYLADRKTSKIKTKVIWENMGDFSDQEISLRIDDVLYIELKRLFTKISKNQIDEELFLKLEDEMCMIAREKLKDIKVNINSIRLGVSNQQNKVDD